MDALQLPPVGEIYSTAFSNIKLYKLTQIIRQDDDNPVRHLLTLLRSDIDNNTFTFLEYIHHHREAYDATQIKGYEVLDAKSFQDKVLTYFSDEQLTKNVDYVKIVAYKNATVSAWNKYIRNNIIKDADKSVITTNDLVISYVTIVNIFNEAVIKNSEEYIFKDVVNYIHPKYGIKGFMVRFQAIHGGHISNPLFIIDHTDKESIAKYIRVLEGLIDEAKAANAKTRAQKWREYFTFKESCLILVNIVDDVDTTKIKYGRSIDYGFALTANKSQGSTFDTVFVDVDDIVFDSNGTPHTNTNEMLRRLYVACSRCKNKLYLKYRW